MKATELMIDDWVLFNDRPVQIKGIAELKKSCYITHNQTDNDWYKDIAIEPIPLTAEILEKNCSIVREGYYLFYNRDEYMYSVNESDGLFYFGSDISIQYVHELQHALSLCGIEKEIQL